MKNSIIFLLLFALQSSLLIAEEGHRIEVTLENYDQQELYLAVNYGDKQYLNDTALVNDEGSFVFAGKEKLNPGVYLVVMAPDNKWFQLLVTNNEQHFSLLTNAESPSEEIEFTGSPENALFYQYLDFLAKGGKEAESVQQQMADLPEEHENRTKLHAKLEELDAAVKAYQKDLVKENPETLTAAIINAHITVDIPDFEGTDEEVSMKKWRFTQEHYFDNLDLGDPRMLRTPFLFQRVDHYINKLQVQHPDTIAQAIDYVLERMKPAEETFKYYLIHFLNSYAKSKYVGMDAVYVHLVENYYAKGLADWTDEEQLKKIVENGMALKPLLIGKIAPDITLRKRDGSKMTLHEIESPYTVLYFWRYDCGACKKSTPNMKEFYAKFKDRGVKIVAVCTKFTDEVPECWKYVEENEIQDWIHAADPYNQAKLGKIYNVKSTPQVYILDENKEIISKRISAEQLEEVMDQIIEMRKKEEAEGR